MRFASSPRVTVQQVATVGSKVPVGEAFTRQLDSNTRDSLSLATLRGAFLGADPLQSGSGPFTVLGYNEFTWPGGIRGSKLVVDITGNNGLVTTFGQLVAVDAQTNWIEGIEIHCRASCWGPNRGLINQIFNSWTVKALK
jgi:hypothetical protein